MSDRIVTPKSHDEPGRFVPKGVDAKSWLGFEQRIQDRRYNVLIETARAAILAGDLRSARAAIDEARELRPAAEELDSLESSLNSEPPMVLPADAPFFRSRAFGAAAMLVVGVTLVTTIDYVRGDGTARVVSAPAMPLPGLRVPLPPVGDIPHPVTALRTQPSPVIPIGTAGLEVRLSGEVNIPASLRASTVTVPESLPLPPGEVPDDFVYPYPRPAPPRSSSPPAITVVAGASDRRQPSANVASAPPPVIAAPLMTPSPIPGAIGPLTPSRPSPAPVPAEVAPPAVTPPAAPPAALAPSNPATFGAPRTTTSIRPASVVNDDAKVTEVLNAYARAYGDLDAAAARAVWPSVDERALARAFSTLSSQTVSFADCRIDVDGVSALASCRGYASYVGKIGSGGTRTEPRQWRFELRRVGEEWRIQNAVVGSRQ